MRVLLLIVVSLALGRSPPVWAALERTAPAEVDALFRAGNEACARGDLRVAMDAYAKIMALGWASPELDYNLGTVYLRAGRVGPAVLYLSRAEIQAPHDLDVQKNLSLARRGAGSPTAARRWPSRLFGNLNESEWRLAVGAAYWLVFLAGGLCLWLPRWRPCRVALGLLLCVLTWSSLGVWFWNSGPVRHRAVIVAGTRQAYLAPTESATAIFTLAEGLVVDVQERLPNDWSRVTGGGRTGWVPPGSIQPILRQ